MSKVSVVIPNFNHARYLDQRLRSVLSQTYRDFEVVVLDDASTDDSLEVLAPYRSDPRIRWIENRVNSGSAYKQWNRGVREARSDYVWIAESDDYADERLLAILVERLERHPRVGVAYCQSWVVDEDGRTLCCAADWVRDLDDGRWRHDFIADGRDECARYLLRKNTIHNASAVVFRRALYEQTGGADESMRLCGDWKVWVEILLRSDLAFVAEPLNYHRTHPATVRQTASQEDYARENWRIAARVLSAVDPPAQIAGAARERLASEWVYVTVQRWKRLFESGRQSFFELKKHDPYFALRSGRQALRAALAAGRRRLAKAKTRLQSKSRAGGARPRTETR